MRTVILLGLSLLGLGGLLWLWSLESEPEPRPLLVHQTIVAPDETLIFNGTVILSPGNGTVEGALRRAADVGGFEVNITRAYFGRSFVVSIAGYQNEGACGWVYDRNGVRGARAVDDQVLAAEDRVHWSWACTG